MKDYRYIWQRTILFTSLVVLMMSSIQAAHAGYGYGKVSGVYTGSGEAVMIMIAPTAWQYNSAECIPNAGGNFWRGSGEAFWIDASTRPEALAVFMAAKLSGQEVFVSGVPSTGYDAPCRLVHYSWHDR
jgi:hypothetical protein